jgi:hypothetical protein
VLHWNLAFGALQYRENASSRNRADDPALVRDVVTDRAVFGLDQIPDNPA